MADMGCTAVSARNGFSAVSPPPATIFLEGGLMVASRSGTTYIVMAITIHSYAPNLYSYGVAFRNHPSSCRPRGPVRGIPSNVPSSTPSTGRTPSVRSPDALVFFRTVPPFFVFFLFCPGSEVVRTISRRSLLSPDSNI